MGTGISRSADGSLRDGLALTTEPPARIADDAERPLQIRPSSHSLDSLKPRENPACPATMDPAKMLEGTRFQGLENVNYDDIVWQVRCPPGRAMQRVAMNLFQGFRTPSRGLCSELGDGTDLAGLRRPTLGLDPVSDCASVCPHSLQRRSNNGLDSVLGSWNGT